MVYADDNLLCENINTIKRDSKSVLLETSKEVGMEVNIKKIKCMFVSSPECRTEL
jgi:hypothetical protein